MSFLRPLLSARSSNERQISPRPNGNGRQVSGDIKSPRGKLCAGLGFSEGSKRKKGCSWEGTSKLRHAPPVGRWRISGLRFVGRASLVFPYSSSALYTHAVPLPDEVVSSLQYGTVRGYDEENSPELRRFVPSIARKITPTGTHR